MNNHVRKAREKRGWSLNKFATLTGINVPDLSAVERGLRYAHPGWRRRIALALKMRPDELFK